MSTQTIQKKRTPKFDVFLTGLVGILCSLLLCCGSLLTACYLSETGTLNSDQKDVTQINIGGWLDSPHISPDGTELYFSYAPLDIHHFLVSGNIQRGGPDRPGHTTSGDTPEALINTDLYMAQKDENGVWKAEAITTVNSVEYLEGCPVLSWDGKKLYFVRDKIGGDEPVKVYVSERTGSLWSPPTVTTIPVGSAGDTHMSTDEMEVVYDHSPDMPGLPMGTELWLATRLNDGTWERHKLPETVNAPGLYQHHPWLSKDGTRLYFVRYPPDEEYFEIVVAYRDIGGTFDRTETLQITGEQAGFYQEPSFPEDEKTLFSAVFVSPEQGIQVWTGEKDADGVFPMRPID